MRRLSNGCAVRAELGGAERDKRRSDTSVGVAAWEEVEDVVKGEAVVDEVVVEPGAADGASPAARAACRATFTLPKLASRSLQTEPSLLQPTRIPSARGPRVTPVGQ